MSAETYVTETARVAAQIPVRQNIESFDGESVAPEFDMTVRQMALWATQIERIEGSNPAVPFLRQLRVDAIQVALLTSLAMYRPAAAVTRSMVEAGLYYSYFRAHPAELSSLIANPKNYVSKDEIIAFHWQHTPTFSAGDAVCGVKEKVNTWYSEASAVVHGQLPGCWISITDSSSTAFNAEILKEVASLFSRAGDIIHLLFLTVLRDDVWGLVAAEVKQELVRGMPGDTRVGLGLDKA